MDKDLGLAPSRPWAGAIKPPEPEEPGYLGALGKGIYAGFRRRLPEMIGQAIQFTGAPRRPARQSRNAGSEGEERPQFKSPVETGPLRRRGDAGPVRGHSCGPWQWPAWESFPHPLRPPPSSVSPRPSPPRRKRKRGAWNPEPHPMPPARSRPLGKPWGPPPWQDFSGLSPRS